MIGFLLIAAFLLSVPLANWLIGNVGTVCIPDGPCLVPVAPGLMAPSGVLVIGAALVLRDAIHSRHGWQASVLAILAGGALSFFVAPATLVGASVAAFLFSEFADLAVYAPLRKRGAHIAVLASGAVGAVVDSALFLFLAFGSLAYMPGQVVGKVWASLFAAAVLWWIARRSIGARAAS